MSFLHKKNVTKCLGHHYAIWTSDSNFLLAQKKNFGPAYAGPHFRHWGLLERLAFLCILFFFPINFLMLLVNHCG